MLRKIALVAAVAAILATPVVAFAMKGGGHGGGGMHMGGGGMHAGGGIRSFGGFRGGHPATFHRQAFVPRHHVLFRRHAAFPRHHVFFRHHLRHHRFFVAGVGLYGYDSCYRRVWTPWGWRWRRICDYDYY